MQLHFTKMHGCGNDYIYLDCRETGLPAEIAVWSQKLSRRHFSIGADGIICICPPLTADGDATMRMFNADGSEGKMCGNGVRCVAQFLYTHGVPKDVIEIDTLMAGRKTLHRKGEGLWQAEMGHFSAMADTLPAVGLGAGPLVHAPLTAAGKTWDAACISTGNPHCIIEWPDCDTLPTGHALAAIGPEFEHHPAFPEGVNTEFVYIESPTSVVMRVWERGSGETFACGTGSCATVAALVLRGVCPRNVPVDVHLLGGISVIYITHDLGVVAKVTDYVDVMYAGKIVETGTIDEIFYEPRHPYTWGLLSAMPDLDTADDRLYTIPGSPPNLLHEKQGDAFAPRNHFALNIDDEVDPPMFKISDTHYAATWLLDPRAPKVDMPPELAQRIARMRAEAEKIKEAE
jgi:diaminopimelate epimerase